MSRLIIVLIAIIFGSCKATNPRSRALEDTAVTAATGISSPFANGEFSGVKWELRFNFPTCAHPDHPEGTWCTLDDFEPGARKSGIEDRMIQWINDVRIKSVTLAFFSFSNKHVRKALCDAATSRGLKVRIYLHNQNIPSVPDLQTCAPGLVELIPRGTIFGVAGGYLQHAKIFLASELDQPIPLNEIADTTQREAAAGSTVYFTSSSANLSANGTSLHLENWIVFESRYDNHLAQENICFLNAINTMQLGAPDAERQSLADKNKTCRDQIATPAIPEVTFLPVPHGHVTPEALPEMVKLIKSAQSSIKIAIHRLTTTSIVKPLVYKATHGVKVSVNFDDDTFRAGKCNGGTAMDVAADDVSSMRALQAAGADIGLVETNGEIGQLHHSKYMIVDDKTLFQGAGNFTATSLNSSNYGNIEYFYIFRDPAIVQAYVKGWEYIKERASTPTTHPVSQNLDKTIKTSSDGRKSLDATACPPPPPAVVATPVPITTTPQAVPAVLVEPVEPVPVEVPQTAVTPAADPAVTPAIDPAATPVTP